jgi:ParB family transcriptional regulator, chromosome partitioning protein
MQPGIVRRIENDPDYDYEIIFGLRRWYACSLAKVTYLAEVTSVDDSSCARMMLDENEQSQDVSELEKCFSMADQVALFGTAAELARQLNLTKQIVGRRLSAAKLLNYPSVMSLLTPVITGVSLQKAKDLIDYIEQDSRTAKLVNKIASELQTPSAGGKTLSESMDQAKSIAPKIIDSLMKTDSQASQADRPRITTYLTNKKGNAVASMSESKGKVVMTIDIAKLKKLKEKTQVDGDKVLSTLLNDLKGYFDEE